MPLPIMSSPIRENSITTILAVAAGKGGVGKSTVAVNLALALHEKGYSIGLLDADIYGPSLRRMLPEVRLPQQEGEWIEPAVCFGIKMISMAFFRREGQPAAIRAPIANSVITQFLNKVLWGKLDYLIIDFPPGTGDIQLTLAQQGKMSAAILVTTPQEVALLDVRKAAALFTQMRVPLLGVVENMSYYQPSHLVEPVYLFGKGGGAKLAEEEEIPLLGCIPIDPAVSFRSDRGFSLFIDDGTGLPMAAEAFRTIADNVLSELDKLGNRTQQRRMREFFQIDSCHFSIVWDDGQKHTYSLSDLQKECPCAACAEQSPQINSEVRAHEMHGVGNYALKFSFNSGCSNGIYDFDMLYQLGERQ